MVEICIIIVQPASYYTSQQAEQYQVGLAEKYQPVFTRDTYPVFNLKGDLFYFLVSNLIKQIFHPSLLADLRFQIRQVCKSIKKRCRSGAPFYIYSLITFML